MLYISFYQPPVMLGMYEFHLTSVLRNSHLKGPINDEIKKENLSEIENKVDKLLEKLNEISGIDEIIFKLDEISSTIQEDEINFEKITNLMKENITIFNKEVDWRKKAFGSLLAKLNQYDDAIKDTIGLRLQERLTKKQAKIVSSCKAIHRDISLNF